jgi:hypothetical protein
LRAEQVGTREETHPKKIPVHFEEDIVYRTVEAPKSCYRDQGVRSEREHSNKEYTVEEPESVARNLPARDYRIEEHETVTRSPLRASKEYSIAGWETGPRAPLSNESSFEDHGTESSRRMQEARKRRRRERNSPTKPAIPVWEQPHVIHPREDDEVVVVTERYEYQPKKKPEVVAEEERRTQEFVDRAAFYIRPDILEHRAQSQPRNFSHEEAASYYHEDWSRDEPELVRREARGGYRRERYQDSELGDSEAGYDYRTRG